MNALGYKRDEKLIWPRLPLWQGQRKERSEVNPLPLVLQIRPDGFIGRVEEDGESRVVEGYSGADYGFITPPPGASDWGTAIGERKLRALRAFAGTMEGLSVLEIGGGNLYFAQVLSREERVSRYVAADPTLRIWPEGTIAETHRTYYPCPALEGQSFDLVIANSCLEHIPDPKQFLLSIRNALTEKGRAFLTFPDVSRQFADGDLGAVLHEHFVYLDEPSARSLFSQCGLEVKRWQSESDLASCLVTRAELMGNSANVDIAAAEALFASACEGYCARLPRAAASLQRALSAGERVAFYGANNGLNNFIYASGLGAELPILDGDEGKRGLFLPAASNAIQWVADADPSKFDRIFISAGSFQPAIADTLTSKYGVSDDRIEGLFRSGLVRTPTLKTKA